MNKIPFHKPLDLTEDQTKYDTLLYKIEDCMNTGQLTNGKNVRQLEESIANLYDAKYAIATSSGTSALTLSLQSLPHLHTYANVPAFTWYSTKYAINSSRLRPKFQDINKDTWNIQLDEQTHPILTTVPVHTFGNVCEVESEYTIYDGAHSLGSKINNFGDATILSLAPTKMITSIEGGIVLTNINLLAHRITALRDKVARMSEIHACFGNIYLEYLDEILNFKNDAFNYYSKNLDGIFQKTDKSTNHNTIGMLTDLKIPETIETRKYYEPLRKGLKNTDDVYKRIICLPSWLGCPYKDIVKMIHDYNKDEGGE